MSINENIGYWLERAGSHHFSGGKKWYQEAHQWCKSQSDKHSVPLSKVVAVTASLSPRVSWERNKILVDELLCLGDCGCIPAHKKRALENLKSFGSFKLGKKTGAFYHNILFYKYSQDVTIDFRIWDFFKLDEWNHITPKRYNYMEKIFQREAKNLSLLPHQLQAILWLTTKELGNE